MANTKKKKVIRNRAELMADLNKSKDFRDKMAFVKTTFYPSLLLASKSIDDAQFFLASLSTMMMQKFLDLMKEKKFVELGLVDILDPQDPKHGELSAMLDLFKDMSVFDAKTLIEGMKQEIQLFINEELKGRALDTLETKWIDELPTGSNSGHK